MLKRITRSQHTGIHRFAVFVGSKIHLSHQDCRDYTLKVSQPIILGAPGRPSPSAAGCNTPCVGGRAPGVRFPPWSLLELWAFSLLQALNLISGNREVLPFTTPRHLS